MDRLGYESCEPNLTPTLKLASAHHKEASSEMELSLSDFKRPTCFPDSAGTRVTLKNLKINPLLLLLAWKEGKRGERGRGRRE